MRHVKELSLVSYALLSLAAGAAASAILLPLQPFSAHIMTDGAPSTIELFGVIRSYQESERAIVLDIKSPYSQHEKGPLRLRVKSDTHLTLFSPHRGDGTSTSAITYWTPRQISVDGIKPGAQASATVRRSVGNFDVTQVSIYEE